ncbi:MAG: hypothetical protein EOP84_08165 [Verrucomicrobiaceae bacterium]|nr:MAG: hypothetical protein EOP84_08165 [Verrucomicrobiaceae bacterium]
MPADVYDAISNPRPNWTRVERVKPRTWPSSEAFRQEMFKEGQRRGDGRKIVLNGLPARVALRQPILSALASGPVAVTNLRERVLRGVGLNHEDAYAVNQHAWALVDLTRAKLVKKVPGKVAWYKLAQWRDDPNSEPAAPDSIQPLNSEPSWLDLCLPEIASSSSIKINEDDVDESWLRIAGVR